MGSALTYLADAAVTTTKIDAQSWDKKQPVTAAACSMQGWRRCMEDAHFMRYNEKMNVYLFGVFDGHGGSGVARYCAERMPEVLFANPNFESKDFDLALHETFMQVDLETQQPAVQDRIYNLHKASKADLSAEDLSKVEIHLAFETILDLFLGDPTDPINRPADPFKVFMDDYAIPNPFDIPEWSEEEIAAASSSPEPAADRKRKRRSSSSSLLPRHTAEPRSVWGVIASRMRMGENTLALSEFKKLISESSLVVDEAVPLLMRLRTEIDWDQAESSWFASDPLSRVLEGSLADLFHLSARGNWIYAIHPVDLLAALSSDYLVVEKGERVRKISQEQGCTATVCLLALNEQVLYCANAGDSRAIIAKHNGQAVPLSIDHKPSLRNERRRVLFAGGQVKGKQDPRVQGDLNLSRAIGDWRHKQNNSLPLELQMISPRPDITATKLSDEDEFIVLGCDGIWERFSSSDCANLVALSSMKAKKIADVTRSVCEATVRKNDEFPGAPIGVTIGCDNMTLLLVRLDEQIRKKFSAPVSYPLTMPIVSYGEQVPEEWNPHTVHPAVAEKRKKKHGKRGHRE